MNKDELPFSPAAERNQGPILAALAGLLVLYGPFVVDGEPTAPSNLAFDADLRRRNPQWGLRHLGEVLIEAVQAGLAPDRRLEMPANNLLLGLRRGGPGAVRSKSQQLHV